MSSALDAFMVSGRHSTQQTAGNEGLEFKRKVRLQQKGADEAMDRRSSLMETLLPKQNESITVSRDGRRKCHLRCHHYCLDNRGLAVSDLPDTYFYLETYSGTCLYSVLFCSSIISYVYVLLSCNICHLLKGGDLAGFIHMDAAFLHFSPLFLN